MLEKPEVLLVEDEAPARMELRRALLRQGFKVREASSGRSAIRRSKKGNIGVVLMDLRLGRGPDGIEAASRIQEAQPRASIIFVSAYADRPEYRERARELNLRVTDWIEKPIQPALATIIGTIRGALAQAEEDAVAASGDRSEVTEMSISAAIDAVYGEMHSLILRLGGRPGLREALRPIRERLRSLQTLEAQEIGQRYDSHFRKGLELASEALEQAREVLKKSHDS